jgi:hypothetical protein
MNEGSPNKLTKERIYSEIERIRSEVQADSKLRMRTQKEIFELLQEALSCLEEKDSRVRSIEPLLR